MINIKKKLAILIIPSLLMAIMLFFAIIPTISQIKETSQNIKDRRSSLELKSLPAQNIKKNINKLNEIKKNSKIYNSFVTKGEELNFIESLENIAKDNSVKQNIEISNPDKKEKLPILIMLEGDYISLLKYLTSLERSEYYINIQSLSFNSVNKKNIIADSMSDNLEKNNLIKLSLKGFAFLR